jgi:hypothetical protein
VAHEERELVLEFADLGATRLHETAGRVLTRADGLVGITAPRGEMLDRAEADGTIPPARSFLSGRPITLEGEAWGDTEGEAWGELETVLAALAAIVNPSSDVLLKFRRLGSTVDLQAAVRLAGPVLPPIAGGGPMLTWQAQLHADDPLLYSTTLKSSTVEAPTSEGGIPFPIPFPIPFGAGVSGGSVSCANDGYADTWPTLRVTGPISGPVLSNVTTGEALRFESLYLAAGQTLVVETAPRLRGAWVGDTSVLGALRHGSSTWFAIGAQATHTIGLSSIGGNTDSSTLLTVEWRDAYL